MAADERIREVPARRAHATGASASTLHMHGTGPTPSAARATSGQPDANRPTFAIAFICAAAPSGRVLCHDRGHGSRPARGNQRLDAMMEVECSLHASPDVVCRSSGGMLKPESSVKIGTLFSLAPSATRRCPRM